MQSTTADLGTPCAQAARASIDHPPSAALGGLLLSNLLSLANAIQHEFQPIDVLNWSNMLLAK